MIFQSIYLKEGIFDRTINFSKGNNLIFSNENSKGKTTLLRILLYSIGYSIPNTKNIKFEDCIIQATIITDNGEELILCRTSRTSIIVQNGDEQTTYALPSQEGELHTSLFGINSLVLLQNLLGLFYFDQEKGWTLLNRGNVIGKNRFQIEEFIRGLEDIDCSEEIERIHQIEKNLEKFKQMYSVSQYQATIDLEKQNFAADSYDETINNQLVQLRVQQNLLKKELKRIDSVANENNRIKEFINRLGILIQLTPDEEPIPLTADKIVNLDDSINYLEIKRNIITGKLCALQREIDKLEKNRKTEEQQLTFFNDEETICQMFDSDISKIPLNEKSINTNITKLEKEKKDLNKRINDLTRNEAYQTINDIHVTYLKYLAELEVSDYAARRVDIFTKELKQLSGAFLHKIVFAFRLACLKVLEKQRNIHLPIILDSPRSGEIDDKNIEKMMQILNRDFSDNQIIIASIYDYKNFDELNRIEIQNQLIE